MAQLKQVAEDYVPPETKNIVELESVKVNVEVENKTVKPGTKDEFSYNYIMVNDEEYRMPITAFIFIFLLM